MEIQILVYNQSAELALDVQTAGREDAYINQDSVKESFLLVPSQQMLLLFPLSNMWP